MEDLWKSALEAAETAKTLAQSVSKKGLELAEATAEEAGRKFKELGLQEAVGAATPEPQQPTYEELAAYGITPEFTDYIRALNYSTFRDFPTEHLLPAAFGPGEHALNAWQLQHAKLVVRAVGEVNELRYVLCPRYMDDQRFWAVYFTLARKHLPEAAYTWTPGDELPPVAEDASKASGDDGSFMSLSEIGGQLRRLSSKLHAAATQSGGPVGLEFSSFLTGAVSSRSIPANGDGHAAAAAQPTAAAEGGGAMLQSDPDLEAYLQVGGDSADGRMSSGEGDDGEGEEGDGEDIDLDRYLNELSAEVGEGGGGEGGGVGCEDDEDDAVDVDAAMRELARDEESTAAAAAEGGNAGTR